MDIPFYKSCDLLQKHVFDKEKILKLRRKILQEKSKQTSPEKVDQFINNRMRTELKAHQDMK